jgi:hypothetical protein
MNPGNEINPQPLLRVTQILVLSLIMGMVMFAGVVFFLEKSRRHPPTKIPTSPPYSSE